MKQFVNIMTQFVVTITVTKILKPRWYHFNINGVFFSSKLRKYWCSVFVHIYSSYTHPLTENFDLSGSCQAHGAIFSSEICILSPKPSSEFQIWHLSAVPEAPQTQHEESSLSTQTWCSPGSNQQQLQLELCDTLPSSPTLLPQIWNQVLSILAHVGLYPHPFTENPSWA